MKDKRKDLLTVVLFAAVIFGLGLAGLLAPPRDYSYTERRALAQKPTLTGEGLASGKYMSRFEEAALDQFPLRDGFRAVKALGSRYLLGRKDNNGYYLCRGYLSKLEYPLRQERIDRNTAKLREVWGKYLAETDCRVRLALIPDKNAFLAAEGGYPAIDYPAMLEDIRTQLDFAEYIDIADTVSLEDFYTTDQHWRQECILDTAQALAAGLNSTVTPDLTEVTLVRPFYGTYYGQAALPVKPDTIRYLTSPMLEGCTVTSYNTGKPRPAALYDLDKAEGRDPYELFLSGSDPLLVVENPAAESDRQLVVFRDSFGSSLVPLLVGGYRRVTLIDLRYLRSDLLGAFVDFSNQDVLFLYSTLIFNHSITM